MLDSTPRSVIKSDMDFMKEVEHDITEMKACTLGKLGKKVELAAEMLEKEKRTEARLTGILERVKARLEKKMPRAEKKKYQELEERITRKLGSSRQNVRKLEDLKVKFLTEYKNQREALGIMDHSFIDEYYEGGDS